MLGGNLRWTSIPSRGSRNTPSCFILQKPEISTGLMGLLDHPITIGTDFTFTSASTQDEQNHALGFKLPKQVNRSVKLGPLFEHILVLSATRKIPACAVSGMDERIPMLLGVSRVAAFGFKVSEKETPFDALVEFIKSVIPPLFVPWLHPWKDKELVKDGKIEAGVKQYVQTNSPEKESCLRQLKERLPQDESSKGHVEEFNKADDSQGTKEGSKDHGKQQTKRKHAMAAKAGLKDGGEEPPVKKTLTLTELREIFSTRRPSLPGTSDGQEESSDVFAQGCSDAPGKLEKNLPAKTKRRRKKMEKWINLSEIEEAKAKIKKEPNTLSCNAGLKDGIEEGPPAKKTLTLTEPREMFSPGRPSLPGTSDGQEETSYAFARGCSDVPMKLERNLPRKKKRWHRKTGKWINLSGKEKTKARVKKEQNTLSGNAGLKDGIGGTPAKKTLTLTESREIFSPSLPGTSNGQKETRDVFSQGCGNAPIKLEKKLRRKGRRRRRKTGKWINFSEKEKTKAKIKKEPYTLSDVKLAYLRPRIKTEKGQT